MEISKLTRIKKNAQACFFAWMLLWFAGVFAGPIAKTEASRLSPLADQGLEVTGTITDDNSTPIIGANVIIKGTLKGTVTDFDGRFSIMAEEGDVLEISYVGFTTEEIVVDSNNTDLNISLSPDFQNLDEVVVIGYGTQKRKDLTSSVATVNQDDFIEGNVTNPVQFLQGKVAGLNISRAGNSDPNGGFQLQLRGLTTLAAGQEPLIVIDGVIGGSLNNIPIDEIESIDVLKDGSAAAIYGTRGTNGVILITTKKPKGTDLRLEISTYHGVQNINRRLEVLSAEEYRNVLTTYFPNSTSLDFGETTDWLDAVTQDNALSQYYNVSASGGSEKLQFRATVNWQDDQGVVKKTSRNRFRGLLNVIQKGFNDRLTLNYNLTYSTGENEYADYYILEQANRRNPTEPIFDINNEFPESGPYYFRDEFQYYNPVAMQDQDLDEGHQRDFMGSVRAELSFTDELSINAQASLIDTYERRGQYLGRYYPFDFSIDGRATITNTLFRSKLFEANLAYNNTFGEAHNISAIAGYSYNDGDLERYNMSNFGFDTDLFSYYNIGSGSALELGQATLDSFRESNRLTAFFGRVQYNYDNRYFLSASVRQEGSSRFGDNNKWGTFPAFSVGWSASNEKFMQDGFFDILKFRAGFGVTGNQAIPNYQSLQLLSPGGRFFFQGEWVNTFRPASNPNPDLKWERKEELNLGLDFGFFDNRFGGAIDYYKRTTKDLLYTYNVPVPPFLYDEFFTNVGTIENEGIEVALNIVPIKKDNFTWTTNLVYSSNNNRLVKFSSEEFAVLDIRSGFLSERFQQFTQRIVEDGPIGNFWGPKFLGTDENGDNVFEDLNSDGLINEDDNQVIGNALPDFTFGITNTFQIGAFDLNVLLRGSVGNDILNVHRLYYEGLSNFGFTNVLRSTLDDLDYRAPAVYSSRYIEDGSYLRLDNVTLGYRMPFKLFSDYSNFRVYVTGQNLAVITSYNGVDPEVNINGLAPGIDPRRYYPGASIILIGLDVNF